MRRMELGWGMRGNISLGFRDRALRHQTSHNLAVSWIWPAVRRPLRERAYADYGGSWVMGTGVHYIALLDEGLKTSHDKTLSAPC